MAGFDFEFRYTESQAPVVAVCLRAAQSRARRLRLALRWQCLGDGLIRVEVNGNSRSTDLLCYRLERDLPLIAEGCNAPGVGQALRERTGRGVVDVILRGRDLSRSEPMVLRGVSRTKFRYPPYDFDCPDFPSLHARLAITEGVLVSWCFNELGAEVVLEELHTAFELALDEAVNRRSKKLSFAELVEKAASHGVLDPHRSDNSALLTDLKDLRKDVRHRAAQGAQEWLDRLWEDAAMLLERIVARLNTSTSVVAADAHG